MPRSSVFSNSGAAIVLAILILGLLSFVPLRQVNAATTITVYRSQNPVTLDGVINPGEWIDTPMVDEPISNMTVAFKQNVTGLLFLMIWKESPGLCQEKTCYGGIELGHLNNTAEMGTTDTPTIMILASPSFKGSVDEFISTGDVAPLPVEANGYKTQTVCALNLAGGTYTAECYRPFNLSNPSPYDFNLTVGTTVEIGFAVGDCTSQSGNHLATDMLTYTLTVSSQTYTAPRISVTQSITSSMKQTGPPTIRASTPTTPTTAVSTSQSGLNNIFIGFPGYNAITLTIIGAIVLLVALIFDAAVIISASQVKETVRARKTSPYSAKRKMEHSTQHKLPLSTLTWSTLGITLLMAALYVLLVFPPSLGTFRISMYFHSIGIGLAALAVYLVIGTFNLEEYEPKIDFPLSLRTWMAVLFGALGGIMYLSPTISRDLPEIVLGLFVMAFILLGDVGGALFIELMLMPRKKAGVYDPAANYFARMFPMTEENRKAYSGLGAAYWLAIASIGSGFIAGMIGFANLWVTIFGPSFFSRYLSYLGLSARSFVLITKNPHSQEMGLALMAGIVAIAVQQYGILKYSLKIKKVVAQTGVWISFIGVVALTIVFAVQAFANLSMPELFPSGPGGVNGFVGSHVVMSIVALGVMILIVPMAVTRLGDQKPFWNDVLRVTLLATWVAAVLVNVVEGFYIELHQDVFTTKLLANLNVYGQVQPLMGIFVLAAAAMVLLAVDYFKVSSLWRQIVGWTMASGLRFLS